MTKDTSFSVNDMMLQSVVGAGELQRRARFEAADMI